MGSIISLSAIWYLCLLDDSTGGVHVFPTSELIAVVTVDASDDDTLLTEFELLSGENTTTIFMGNRYRLHKKAQQNYT